MVLRQRSSHDDRFRSDVLGGIRTHGILLAKKDSTETELRGPRVRQQRDRGTTAPANVPRETRTLSLARAKGTFFLLELRARSFARWLSRSAVLATYPWARDDDTEPATAKSRVGFEPTMRWLCKPLRSATLPPAHSVLPTPRMPPRRLSELGVEPRRAWSSATCSPTELFRHQDTSQEGQTGFEPAVCRLRADRFFWV